MTPTIVWYKSAVLWGFFISATMKALYLAGVEVPAVDDQKLAESLTLLASFVGDAIGVWGRLASPAQPVTLSEEPAGASKWHE